MSAPDLPRDESGAVDWERAFEETPDGFIPLIQQAGTAATLRERAIEVVGKLHSRQDDPLEIDRFIGQLNQLIPDTTSDETLHHISAAVSSLLRQMKAHRIQAAREHAALRRRARQAERRRAVIEAAEARRKWRLVAIGSAALAVLIGGVTAYEIMKQPDEVEDEIADAIVDKMRDVAKSGQPVSVGITTIRLQDMNGRPAVIVDNIPQAQCFDTAWGLVNQGTLLVNGLSSSRLSPTILRELCQQSSDRASIVWMPK